MGIVSFLFIIIASCPAFGNVLNQVWIDTIDNGVTEVSESNVHQIYTKLSDYELNIAPGHFLRFQVKACNDAFILLSSAYDLNSTLFYEMVIGAGYNGKTVFRKSFTGLFEIISSDILNCNVFIHFIISWSAQTIVLEKTLPASEVIFTWTDTSPITINGIGIRTGYGAYGTWIIEHEAMLMGYNCGRPDTYGDMLVLQTTVARSVVECNTLCAPTDQCLGINFHSVTNECQLIAGGQVVKRLFVNGWSFFTKCLNKTNVCLACLN